VSTRHFVLWTTDTRTLLASRHAYRRGEAGWRFDQAGQVPDELVEELGWWDWQTPINGPFPAFSADRLPQILGWLQSNDYTALVVEEPA